MTVPDSFVMGDLFYPESKEKLALILVEAGIEVTVGNWSVRLENFARTFSLRYVGNLTPESPFQVDGDGYGVPVEFVAACCDRLATCLREHRIGYDFFHATGEQEVICEYQYSP